MLVFIGKLPLSTLSSDEYPCARVSVFLHHFLLTKLATSNIRVNPFIAGGQFGLIEFI